MGLRISRITAVEFSYTVPDVGTDEAGFNLVYDPGGELERRLFGLRVHTNRGPVGEYVGGNSPGFAQVNLAADYLIGKNPLHRQRHWDEINRGLRKYDRMGLGPIDIALWDWAGKYHGTSICDLLGRYRERLPAYASTYQGDEYDEGLSSPGAYADFARTCLEMGYTGFKIHPWMGSDRARDVKRYVRTVEAVGERVGSSMDLMLDPACELETFADALAVGRACDRQNFYWYEDPFRDGGISQHAHRRLGEMLDTPLLQTEHVRGLQQRTDFAVHDGTSFLRADPEYDGGITGVMKAAGAAEALGLDLELHAPGPAQRHCMGAIRNTNYYEMALVHPRCSNTQPPVYWGGYRDGLDSIDGQGTVPVPSGPGLGVDYDWSFIRKHRTGKRVYD